MYAVIGATGRSGRVAVEQLRTWGAPVRAIVRDEGRAADLKARGAEVAVADARDPEALRGALDGVRGLYFVIATDFAAADPVSAVAELGENVIEAALAAGVGHLVLLSSLGAQHPSGTGPVVGLHRLEQRLRTIGRPATLLRASYFAENWGQVTGVVRSDGVLPSFIAADQAIPTVDTRDIGRVAAELLVEGGAGTRVVELAGPVDVRPTDVAAAFAAALGREVQVGAAPPAAAGQALRAVGLPAPIAAAYQELYEGVAAGRLDPEGALVRGRVPLADSVAALLRG